MGSVIAMGAGKHDAKDAQRRSAELARAIRESKLRSAEAGIDKNAEALPPVTREDIEIARKNVYGGVAYTRKMHLGYLSSFNSLVESLGGATFYLDHSLRVCGLGGDALLLQRLGKKNLKFGASLSEDRAGTNAAAITRELMCGCRLDPQDNYCKLFRNYMCFTQGPITIGIDDFIVALVVIPHANLTEASRLAVEHALLALGIISLRNERLHADASDALLDILMTQRGLAYLIVDEHERIVNISQNFLDAFGLQGSRTVGAYARERISALAPVLDRWKESREEDFKAKVDGLQIEGLPAWALAANLSVDGTRLLGIAVKSGLFRPKADLDENDAARIDSFIGSSREAAETRDRMRRIARRDDPILIVGEHGTGKKFAARAIHQASSRRKAPFISCDCALLDGSDDARMLFGSPDTPGLFEQARGGTLLLSGIEQLSPRLQAMIGAVLDEGFLNLPGFVPMERGAVRIMLSSTQEAQTLLSEGTISKNFYLRAPSIVLRMPALRSRADDVPAVARHLLQLYSIRNPANPLIVPGEDELRHLSNLPWLGNIRELKNAVDKAVVEAELGKTGFDDIAQTIVCESSSSTMSLPHPETCTDEAASCAAKPESKPLEAYERDELIRIMRANHGNKSSAAASLGITRKTLYARLRKHGLID